MIFHLTLVSLYSTLLVSATCIHGTALYRKSLNERANTIPFGYTNQLSPLNWANLDPDFAACAKSSFQSPINIDNTTALANQPIQIDIPLASSSSVLNLGTTVEVHYKGVTTFQNQTYNLTQFHFHTPSEHRINEEYFPLEMHMVHQNTNNISSILVLAVLFELSSGPGIGFIDNMVSALPAITNPGTNTTVSGIDLTPAIDLYTSSAYFQYSGSLTTPPCSEGVMFLIPTIQLPITVDQFNALKRVIKFNSRYTQNKLGDGNLLQIAKGNDTNS